MLKNIFLNKFMPPNTFDSSFVLNDSFFENNTLPPIHSEDGINLNLYENNQSGLFERNIQEKDSDQFKLNKDRQIKLAKADCACDNLFDSNGLDINDNITESSKINNNLNNESLSPKNLGKQNLIINRKKKRGPKGKNEKGYCYLEYKISNDNIIRKCKSLVLTYSLDFINYQLRKIYNQNIGQGINMRKLLDIDQEQKASNKVKDIRQLLTKSLREIFSVKISSKYTSFLSNHNEIIIKRALSEKDEDKRGKLNKLFNLTFIDCLNKFLGNNNDEFDGFPLFDEIKSNLAQDDEYLVKIKEYLINFEDIIKNIRARK